MKKNRAKSSREWRNFSFLLTMILISQDEWQVYFRIPIPWVNRSLTSLFKIKIPGNHRIILTLKSNIWSHRRKWMNLNRSLHKETRCQPWNLMRGKQKNLRLTYQSNFSRWTKSIRESLFSIQTANTTKILIRMSMPRWGSTLVHGTQTKKKTCKRS